MEYNLAKEYLNQIEKKGSIYGLESMRQLLARLGDPQKKMKFVHVAGTNGKGSVVAYLSEILKTAGYRTGRYTSPAVFSERERYCVNCKEISEEQMGELIEVVKKAADSMVQDGLAQPTLFEVETAMAFLFFIEQRCDIAVVECGLGGALDATNIIETAECAVITSVSYDHMGILGHSLQEIALQKAGIIHKNVPVVSAVQQQEVDKVLKEVCSKKQTSLKIAVLPGLIRTEFDTNIQDMVQIFDYNEYKAIQISLLGQHQLQNAAVAMEIIEVLRHRGYEISQEAVREGLKNTKWPGRFTRLNGKYNIYMDGAHNEAAAIEVVHILENYFPNKNWIFIIGILADKEYEKVIAMTAKYASWIYTITPDSSRALPADKLSEVVRKYNESVSSMKSLGNAVEEAMQKLDSNTAILTFGSLSFLKNFKEITENYMIRVDKIIENSIFLESMKKLEKLEEEREFCKHDWSHLLDVARIAYIINLEKQLGFSKEIIYASALLHDLGRVKQYEEGIPHEQAGVILAEQILLESGFVDEEMKLIIAAISGHSNKQNVLKDSLPDILFEADKKSRRCFTCRAADQCNWEKARRNATVMY